MSRIIVEETTHEDKNLQKIIDDYQEYKSIFKKRTSNPENFLTISELESLVSGCIRNTSKNILNATSQMIEEIDEKELIRLKKENGQKGE